MSFLCEVRFGGCSLGCCPRLKNPWPVGGSQTAVVAAGCPPLAPSQTAVVAAGGGGGGTGVGVVALLWWWALWLGSVCPCTPYLLKERFQHLYLFPVEGVGGGGGRSGSWGSAVVGLVLVRTCGSHTHFTFDTVGLWVCGLTLPARIRWVLGRGSSGLLPGGWGFQGIPLGLLLLLKFLLELGAVGHGLYEEVLVLLYDVGFVDSLECLFHRMFDLYLLSGQVFHYGGVMAVETVHIVFLGGCELEPQYSIIMDRFNKDTPTLVAHLLTHIKQTH